jgi:hypothetical protein
MFFKLLLLFFVSHSGVFPCDISVYAYVVPWLGLPPPLSLSPPLLKIIAKGFIVLFHISI